MKKRVAFIRFDKIGDLIATLPVDQKVPADWEVTWIVDHRWLQIMQASVPARSFLTIDFSNPALARKLFRQLLATEKFEAAVVFYGPWWSSFELWRAALPFRAGRLSQWHQFLFLNLGVRQSRSQSQKHEMEYNQELVKMLAEKISDSAEVKSSSETSPTVLLKARPQRELLEKHQMSEPYVVVHPGMAGSARNWPSEHYQTLLRELLKKTTVVITGTQSDEAWSGP